MTNLLITHTEFMANPNVLAGMSDERKAEVEKLFNRGQIISIIAHETADISSHNSNDYNAQARASMNEAIWDILNYANENTNSMSGSDWLALNSGSSVIQSGNSDLVNSLYNTSQGEGSVDFKVEDVGRDLNNFWMQSGRHSFIVSTPDSPEDFDTEGMIEHGINSTSVDREKRVEFLDLGNGKIAIITGGYEYNGNLVSEFNNSTDVKAMEDYYINGKSTNNATNSSWDYDVETKEIKPISGLSDTEFIYNIITNTINYQNNTETNSVNYSLNPAYSDNGYNCNSFSNGLLQNSGSSQTEPNDFNGVDWGKYNPVPSHKFDSSEEQENVINNFNNIVNGN